MNRTIFSSLLALTALGSAQAAQAQAQTVCVAPADAADAVVYALPTAYDATMNRCKAQFSDESFLKSEAGNTFIGQFRDQRDARWAGTFRFLKVFLATQQDSDSDNGMAQMLGSMEEDQLRPFVDAFLGQMIQEQIKPDSCGDIDRGVELLSPLPVENVGGLVAFALEQAKLENPPVCKMDEAMGDASATTSGE